MNFDENDQQSIAQFVWRELARHKQLSLATVDEQGNPWNVCVNLSYEDDLNIFWKSLTATEHSKHIAVNPNVAICIFSENAEVGDYGLYLSCKAREAVTDEEISYVIKHRYEGKKTPPIDDFKGASPARLYIAEAVEVWVNDDRHTKTKVDLTVLRKQNT